MIDTIRLRIDDLKVSRENSLTVQPASFKFDGEPINEFALFHVDGDLITGAKSFWNTDKFRLDINGHGHFLTTEINKWKDGNSIQDTTLKDWQDIYKPLTAELKAGGIQTELKHSYLSRLDLAHTREMKYSPSLYFPVLYSCRGKRQEKRNYGTTVLFKNTQRQACFYNKFTQLGLKAGKGEIVGIPEKSLRGEIRLLKKRSVLKYTGGMSTFTDIAKGWDHLPNVYQEQLESQIFRYGTDQPEQTELFASEFDLFERLYYEGKNSAMTKYIMMKGIPNVDMNLLNRLLETFYSSKTVGRNMLKIEKMVNEVRKAQKRDQTEFNQLYNELLTGFYQKAA